MLLRSPYSLCRKCLEKPTNHLFVRSGRNLFNQKVESIGLVKLGHLLLRQFNKWREAPSNDSYYSSLQGFYLVDKLFWENS